MWADNSWIHADQMRWLRILVNEMIDELMGPGKEPKPEWLWWTSTYGAEATTKMEVGSRRSSWEMPCMEELDLLGYIFRRNSKVTQGTERTLNKGMTSWWRDAHIYRANSVPMRAKCDEVVRHALSKKLNGSGMEQGEGHQSKKMGASDHEVDLETEDDGWGRVGRIQEKNTEGNEKQIEEDETSHNGGKMQKRCGRP